MAVWGHATLRWSHHHRACSRIGLESHGHVWVSTASAKVDGWLDALLVGRRVYHSSQQVGVCVAQAVKLYTAALQLAEDDRCAQNSLPQR
jgi:hypothetical protein